MPLWIDEQCKDICVLWDAYQRVAQKKKYFNNQVDLTFSVDFSQPHPRHPCHPVMGSWTNWPWRQWWRLCKLSETWASTLQCRPAYGYCWVYSLPTAEVNTESRCVPTSWDDRPRFWFLFFFSHWTTSVTARAIVLAGTEILHMSLPSLDALLLPKLPSMDLGDSLSTTMLFHKALPLIKELTSQKFFQHPEAAGLIEQWNGILKAQVQSQLGITLQCWDKILQKTINALIQWAICSAVSFFHGQDMQVKGSRSEHENETIYSYSLMIH